MKALTLTQPWATLVISGAKRIETRSWPTAYRGRIAIHAAKGMPRWAREACYEIYFARALDDRHWDELPRGCVIGTVDIIDCRPTESFDDVIMPAEREMGDFAPGRFGWVLANPIPITPVPAGGALGLWEWEPPASARGLDQKRSKPWSTNRAAALRSTKQRSTRRKLWVFGSTHRSGKTSVEPTSAPSVPGARSWQRSMTLFALSTG